MNENTPEINKIMRELRLDARKIRNAESEINRARSNRNFMAGAALTAAVIGGATEAVHDLPDTAERISMGIVAGATTSAMLDHRRLRKNEKTASLYNEQFEKHTDDLNLEVYGYPVRFIEGEVVESRILPNEQAAYEAPEQER